MLSNSVSGKLSAWSDCFDEHADLGSLSVYALKKHFHLTWSIYLLFLSVSAPCKSIILILISSIFPTFHFFIAWHMILAGYYVTNSCEMSVHLSVYRCTSIHILFPCSNYYVSLNSWYRSRQVCERRMSIPTSFYLARSKPRHIFTRGSFSHLYPGKVFIFFSHEKSCSLTHFRLNKLPPPPPPPPPPTHTHTHIHTTTTTLYIGRAEFQF